MVCQLISSTYLGDIARNAACGVGAGHQVDFEVRRHKIPPAHLLLLSLALTFFALAVVVRFDLTVIGGALRVLFCVLFSVWFKSICVVGSSVRTVVRVILGEIFVFRIVELAVALCEVARRLELF